MSVLLSPRLDRIFSLTPPCKTAADIGTDHGYLAARLIESGKADHVLCTDLSPASLEKAKKTFSRLGLEKCAEFLVGDGLEPIKEYPCEVVIVAGLGGDTLCRVLDQPKEVLLDKTFLLQPMSKHEPLRRFLACRGFHTEGETLVRDKNRIYPVLRVSYDGKARAQDDLSLFCGADNLLKRDEVTRAYFSRVYAHLSRAKRHDTALIPVADALKAHLRSLEEETK